MNDKEYSNWLQSHVANTAVANYIKQCQQIEDNLNIDLDDEFIKDKGISLLAKLTYTTNDQLHSKICFNDGLDLQADMNLLKIAVSKYLEFCQRNITSINIKDCSKKDQDNVKSIIDSYQEFLTSFGIDKKSFFEWGISSTIFPSAEKVALEWDSLKKRIFTNQKVYIRGYGRDAQRTQLYKDLYAELFNNFHVVKDPSNNTIPHKLMQHMTGLKRNNNIYNYQVSHIWGNTKNIFMFEAPWNICYMPKIMDPFTGHETQGLWPAEYQKLFITKASKLYKPFIDEYNQLLITLDIENRLQEYILSLNSIIPPKILKQFSKDATKELSSIK